MHAVIELDSQRILEASQARILRGMPFGQLGAHERLAAIDAELAQLHKTAAG
jgi:hypothetical protein